MLHWVIRQDPWVRAIFLAAGVPLDDLAERILDVSTFEDSEAMMSRSLALWERILGITPEEDASLDARRGAVGAMWAAALPPSIAAIQAVCDAWRAGEIRAEYEAEIGTAILYYLGAYGPQKASPALERALGIVKPAHIALEHAWRRLLVKEVHGQMSVAELEQTPKNWLAGGTGTKDRFRGSGILRFGDCLVVRRKSKVRVVRDRHRLRILDRMTYEAPYKPQIGDGLWRIDGALTVAEASRVTPRTEGRRMYIDDEEG